MAKTGEARKTRRLKRRNLSSRYVATEGQSNTKRFSAVRMHIQVALEEETIGQSIDARIDM